VSYYNKTVYAVCSSLMLLVVSLQSAKPTLGSKPCLVFTGEAFDGDAEYKRLKNCFIGELVLTSISKLRPCLSSQRLSLSR